MKEENIYHQNSVAIQRKFGVGWCKEETTTNVLLKYGSSIVKGKLAELTSIAESEALSFRSQNEVG